MKTYTVYLNGELKITETTYVVSNPATGDELARMSTVARPVVARAIQDAHTAFQTWRQVPGRGRGEAMQQLASELQRRREEIARLITLENGKPIAQSQGEVALALDHLRWFAEEARRGYGRVLPSHAQDKRDLVIKAPIGVIGAICPWNFPLTLAVRKVAAALAAGCTVILKPAARTPLSAAAFAECVDAVKLPRGVFQLVAGSAAEIAKEMLDNPLCRKITFTGSTAVGKELIAGAAKHVKPLSLELGGHAPVLIFEDADLETALSGTMLAKFRNSGQSCIAANRIYVQRSMYDTFVKRFADEVRALKVGDGLDPRHAVGPLIDEEAVARAVEHVQDAVRGGGRVLCGGKRMAGRGTFFEATVLADVPRGALCMQEETFAPIAPVCPFETEAEAIENANQSLYGLSAYVFTRDLGRIFRLAETLEVGILAVNDGLPTTSQAPFGGCKQSGWGRELGSEGMEAFLETKHLCLGL